jgi:hypothetical protein
MKVARIQIDTEGTLLLIGIGLVPGIVCPALIWLNRTLQGSKLDGDFWLGFASSYLVALGVSVLLCLWLEFGCRKVNEQELWLKEERREQIQRFFAACQDPLFGPPYREDGFVALELAAGTMGEGTYCKVRPKVPAPGNGCRVTVFRHLDGFTCRQRETYVRIVTDYDALWKSIYPDLNKSYKEFMVTGRDMPEGSWLREIKIGKDEPECPVGFMLSVEYDQDEFVDVWIRGSRFAKAEFYM